MEAPKVVPRAAQQAKGRGWQLVALKRDREWVSRGVSDEVKQRVMDRLRENFV